ncbi:MAG: phosphoadenylyl-sulfate reductase [Bacteroidota bacterium]
MTTENIKKYIENYQREDLKLFVTSSFQTHSIPLLHIISEIDRSIPVMFINTGFLFPETLEFRDEIVDQFGLNMVNVTSSVPKIHQRDSYGNLLFTSDPDRCCAINKTQPMETILAEYDIWINGVRADQNTNRKNMKIEQDGAFNCKRFHPILDWNSKMIYDYAKKYNLPKHPLEEQGYLSIGCEPCTRKMDLTNDRSGRWFGLNKTECGLHTDLAGK